MTQAIHEFDDEQASDYAPVAGFVKTAILVAVADEDATTVIRAPFAEQTMIGPFYIVAHNGDSYGAAPAEFEGTHERVGPNTWRKVGLVRAYRVSEACTVETWIAGGREASVDAQPGDWIVRQATGELMAITPAAFAERYEPVNPAAHQG